jgi:hypothetical protein
MKEISGEGFANLRDDDSIELAFEYHNRSGEFNVTTSAAQRFRSWREYG